VAEFSGPVKHQMKEMRIDGETSHNSTGEWSITELNYEINHQIGRGRAVAWTEPLLVRFIEDNPPKLALT
jgi:hypothetical protein